MTTSARCLECPLTWNPIPGESVNSENGKVQVAFVGIAPGFEERIEKPVPRVFVGKAGQVLRQTADRMDFKSYHLTNTCLCPYDDNTPEGGKEVAATCCRQRLLNELDEVKPELVVALGNVPFGTLTGLDYPITSIAGRVFPTDLTGLPYPVLAVENPAGVLRRPEEFIDYVESLESGERWLSNAYQQAVIPEMEIIDDKNFPEFLQKLENVNKVGDPVCLDLETTKDGFYPFNRNPDQIRCISVAFDPVKAYIVPGKSSPHFEPHKDYTTNSDLRELLEKTKGIYHNAPFDTGFFWADGIEVKCFYDTFLAHYMMDEREYSHGLKKLAVKYLGAYDWEEDIKKYLPTKKASYDLIPDHALYWYAAHDSPYTYQLYERFKERINGGIFHSLIMPCIDMYSEIRRAGIKIDIEVMMELDGILEEEFNQQQREIDELVGFYLNPNSPQEVAKYLYDDLKLPVLKRFGRSTSKKLLEHYRYDYEIVNKIIEARETSKLQGTYVRGLAFFVDEDYHVHPLTNLHGSVTGRISTQDPNVMNIVKRGGIKRLYLPDVGDIVEVDQKQMELRCYSVIADDKHLMQLLNESWEDPSKDPHRMVANEASERTGRKIERGPAKTGVFGRLYGRGLESFMRGFRMDKPSAQGLMGTIDGLFPSIKEYNKWVREEIHTRGYLESFFGRKRRFGLITDELKNEYYRQGANFLVQSMASDVNLYCMLHLHQNFRETLGIRPLFPVHDSIVFDVQDRGVIPELRKEIERFSKELVGSDIDFKVDVKAGKSWGDTEVVPE